MIAAEESGADEAEQQKLAAGMSQPPQLFGVASAALTIEAVQATDVEDQIERFAQKIQAADIAEMKSTLTPARCALSRANSIALGEKSTPVTCQPCCAR